MITLSSVATVLKEVRIDNDIIVLAVIEGTDPFVTWFVDKDGREFFGNFFTQYDDAAIDFAQRTLNRLGLNHRNIIRKLRDY